MSNVDLLHAVKSYWSTNATLTNLCSNVVLESEVDPSVARPYVVISEPIDASVTLSFGRNRVNSHAVRFEVFADTRAACVALLHAIEDQYRTAQLTCTRYVKVHFPDYLGSGTRRMNDCWKGRLDVEYYTEFRP